LKIEPESLQAKFEYQKTVFSLLLSIARYMNKDYLHLYHVQRVQALQHRDPFWRIAFCQWRGRKIAELPNFLSRLLATDEIEIV
jgi:hypothetical protein